MPVPRPSLLAFSLTLAACQLDWTERPDPADGGATPLADAGVEAQAPGEAGAPDASTDGGTDCVALQAAVDDARKKARSCQLASGQCQSTVKDQCGCEVVVAVNGSAATAAFQSAVAKLVASPACVTGCGTSCPGVVNKNCLSTVDGTLCYQQ